jgi:hypothetical protein
MDTWSALLLQHEKTAMVPSQKLKFVGEEDVPPTLAAFEGRVAERHVENIKTMKRIGMKRYIDACHSLSPEEILLRQKVYNFFIGPGMISLWR